MKINISYVQNLLSKQNYLEFDTLLTEMYKTHENGISITIEKDNEIIKTLNTFDDIEEFKKRMVQIYGIYAFI